MKNNAYTDLAGTARNRLKEVIDPGTNADILTMGLVRDLQVNENGELSLVFKPSSTECPLVVTLAFQIRKAIENIEGIKKITITVTGHRLAGEVMEMLNDTGESG